MIQLEGHYSFTKPYSTVTMHKQDAIEGELMFQSNTDSNNRSPNKQIVLCHQ